MHLLIMWLLVIVGHSCLCYNGQWLQAANNANLLLLNFKVIIAMVSYYCCGTMQQVV